MSRPYSASRRSHEVLRRLSVPCLTSATERLYSVARMHDTVSLYNVPDRRLYRTLGERDAGHPASFLLEESAIFRIDNPALWAAMIARMRSRTASSSRVVAKWSLVFSFCSCRTRCRSASLVSMHRGYSLVIVVSSNLDGIMPLSVPRRLKGQQCVFLAAFLMHCCHHAHHARRRWDRSA